eukprot:6534872-Prymnesium_polylepis.1
MGPPKPPSSASCTTDDREIDVRPPALREKWLCGKQLSSRKNGAIYMYSLRARMSGIKKTPH